MRIILELNSNYFVGADAEDLADRALFPEQTRHAVEAVRQAFDGALYRAKSGYGTTAPRLFYPKIGDSLAPPTFIHPSKFINQLRKWDEINAVRRDLADSILGHDRESEQAIMNDDPRANRPSSYMESAHRKLQAERTRLDEEREAEFDRMRESEEERLRQKFAEESAADDERRRRLMEEATVSFDLTNEPSTRMRINDKPIAGDITFSSNDATRMNETFSITTSALIFHFDAPVPDEAGTIRLTVAPHAQRDATLAALNGELTKQEYIDVAAVLGIDHGVALFLSDWMPDVEQAHDEAEGGSR